MDEFEWTRLKHDLIAADELPAERAFTKLRAASMPRLRAELYNCHIRSADQIEDLMQNAYLKMWQIRRRYRPEVYWEWVKYLNRTAMNLYIDDWRKRMQESRKVDELKRRVSDEELRSVVMVLARLNTADRADLFLDYADVLWLGMDGALSPETHRLQRLAALLYYVDGWPAVEILDTVRDMRGAPAVTPGLLDAWLTHSGVIRALAYSQLFYTRDRLAWYLLGKAEPVQVQTLNELSRASGAMDSASADRAGGRLSGEASIILWRYRHGMRPEEILKRSDCPYDGEQLCRLLATLASRLPFNSQMTTLLSGLAPHLGQEHASKILAAPGLWQRLAFQYHYGEELALHDVCERLQAPAMAVGYELNAANLNVWLSGKRLIQRLIRSCAPLQGDDSNG